MADETGASSLAPPYLVAINLTRRCNLHCAHCYLDAGTRCEGAPAELETSEITRILDEIAALSPETMVVFTGGEPMMRPDLTELISHASGLGLMAVLGTNGTMLTEKRTRALQDAGLQGLGISIDSLDPDYHDRFRALPGCWEKAMAGIDVCRRLGLLFQIHFSVTDDNADELPAMIDFAKSAGAFALNVFFLVCTGRGEGVTNISPETYDRVLRDVVQAAYEEKEILIRAKCAPHFKRMAMELDPSWPITAAHGYDAGGCLAGTRYCRVTPNGAVTACPYMEEEVGDLRHQAFAEIWAEAPAFASLRQPQLLGRCGACEYSKICGGCRARPLARDGQLMGEDFLCAYEPQEGAVIAPFTASSAALAWSPDAEARLERVPPFIRRFVRRRAEEFVREAGESLVTPAHLETLAGRRFGEAGPPKGFAGMGPQGFSGPKGGNET